MGKIRNKKPIILIGAGGHAEACIDLLNEQEKFALAEIVGKKKEINKKISNKYKVNYADISLKSLSKKYKYAMIGVGQIQSKKIKLEIFKKLKKLRFSLPKILSKHAVVSKFCKIGDGTVIMHGAIIGPGVSIGENCIINSKALIEHGVTIGDNSHIATSVTINSGVKVGSGSFVGSGSTIKQLTKIKKNSFIKMRSRIINNI